MLVSVGFHWDVDYSLRLNWCCFIRQVSLVFLLCYTKIKIHSLKGLLYYSVDLCGVVERAALCWGPCRRNTEKFNSTLKQIKIWCVEFLDETAWPRITRFYTNIHTDQLYSHTWYEVTGPFRSEVIAKKLSKMPPLRASGGIFRERFQQGASHFAHLSGTINLPHKHAGYNVTSWFHLPATCN